jgi:HSP20 family protein
MSDLANIETKTAEDTAVTAPRGDERPVIVQRPQVSTREDENGVHLQVALPGVRKDDLKLTIHESNLQIRAARHVDVPENWKAHRDLGGRIHYELNARLTDRLDGSRVSATLEDGVLSLFLPLREEAKPREIQIS